MFFKRFILLTCLALSLSSFAVEFELKQKVKSRASVVVSDVDKNGQGIVLNQEDKRKNRKVYQTRFVAKFDPILGGFKPYAQLGYEFERKQVNQYFKEGNQSLNESYNEYVSTTFIGVGLKYTLKGVLMADKIKFDFRYDNWIDVDVERSALAQDASPLKGSFSGYERKIKIESLYSTPIVGFKLQPQIEYGFFKQEAWQNELTPDDLQIKEKGHDLEARLLMTWLPQNIENLELSIGPEIVAERASEYEPGEGWVTETDDVTLLTFLGIYEMEKHNLEFELWLNHQLDGELDGENNLEFKVDWSF